MLDFSAGNGDAHKKKLTASALTFLSSWLPEVISSLLFCSFLFSDGVAWHSP